MRTPARGSLALGERALVIVPTYNECENVTRIVMVNGFVNAVDNFSDSPAVINGASELFLAVVGEAGKHARAAVAVNGLPRGTTVEVQVVAEVR